MDFLTGVFLIVGLRRSQGLVGTSGQEESGKTVGNPMVEPVRLLALRVHGDRARPVSWLSSGKGRY